VTEKRTRQVNEPTRFNLEPVSRGDIAVRVRAEMLGHQTQPRRDVSRSPLERPAAVLGRAIFGSYLLFTGVKHFAQREPVTGAVLVAGGLGILAGLTSA